jgi:hypothetical protein
MDFFSRLFKRKETSDQLTCPRCLGKGHVDRADIIRLQQQGKWGTGTCAYCNGSGSIDKAMLAKVPADATYLTSSLSESEREAVINYNNWGSSYPVTQKREGCPVSEQNRLWLEEAFLLLLDFFGKENTQHRKVLIPHHANFPIQYNGTEQSAYETMKIVAIQMDVPFDSIELGFYDDGVNEISTGSPMGGRIFLEAEKGYQSPAGLYGGSGQSGKYEIWLNRKQLSEPESLVATLAHEIAHIKLLGENRIEENNEYLTDLTTVIFGLGIFTANSAFQTYKGIDYYGWKSQGYLTQMQWGYSLALFTRLRGEKSPDWMNHLTPNVKSDFLQGQSFIEANPDLVFLQVNK